MMQTLELGTPTQQSERDLPVSDDIQINDLGPVMRAAGNGIELVAMNWISASAASCWSGFNFRSRTDALQTAIAA